MKCPKCSTPMFVDEMWQQFRGSYHFWHCWSCGTHGPIVKDNRINLKEVRSNMKGICRNHTTPVGTLRSCPSKGKERSLISMGLCATCYNYAVANKVCPFGYAWGSFNKLSDACSEICAASISRYCQTYNFRKACEDDIDNKVEQETVKNDIEDELFEDDGILPVNSAPPKPSKTIVPDDEDIDEIPDYDCLVCNVKQKYHKDTPLIQVNYDNIYYHLFVCSKCLVEMYNTGQDIFTMILKHKRIQKEATP